MNKFLLDRYAGMQNRQNISRSFSAYDSPNGESLKKSTLSERDQAIETARMLKERMKKEKEKEASTSKTLFEKAKEAKENLNRQKEVSEHPQNNEHSEPIIDSTITRKDKPDKPETQTDEEIRNNLKIMEELNKKAKNAPLSGTPDDILSSVLSDLF